MLNLLSMAKRSSYVAVWLLYTTWTVFYCTFPTLCIWDHSFRTYVCVAAAGKVSFSENSVYTLNERSLSAFEKNILINEQ